MALHYYLDGYNVIKRSDRLADLSLEAGREALIRWIERLQPQGSWRNRVTVIFDGQPGVYGGRISSDIEVVFTRGETADDRIKAMILQAENASQCVVVTDDRNLQYSVRSQGASVFSVSEFVGKVSSSRKSTGGKSSKVIPENLRHKIDSEFRDIWLNDEK